MSFSYFVVNKLTCYASLETFVFSQTILFSKLTKFLALHSRSFAEIPGMFREFMKSQGEEVIS